MSDVGTGKSLPGLPPELVRLAGLLAHRYFVPGCEPQDVLQEAMIGAWIAVRDYRPEADVPLGAFATLVIRRRLIDKIKTANRESRRAQVEAVDELHLAVDPSDVEETILARERLAEILARLPSLTEIERAALRHYANGRPYTHHGSRTVAEKSIDNALRRARQKLAA